MDRPVPLRPWLSRAASDDCSLDAVPPQRVAARVTQLQAAAEAAQVPPTPETRLEFSGAWSAWNQPFVLRYLMQRSTRCTSERAHVSRRYASNGLMIALKVAGFVPVQLQ